MKDVVLPQSHTNKLREKYVAVATIAQREEPLAPVWKQTLWFFRTQLRVALPIILQPGILAPLILTLVYGIAVTFLHQHGYGVDLPLWASSATTAMFTLLIFVITFHNQACEDRWWDGRGRWGALIGASIMLSQQAALWIPDERIAERLSRFVVIQSILLKCQLQSKPVALSDLEEVASEEEVEFFVQYPGWAFVHAIGIIRSCATEGLRSGGQLSSSMHRAINENIEKLLECGGRCITIKSTPFNAQQRGLMTLFTWVYLALFPWTVVPSCGLATPVIHLLVAKIFFGLEHAGYEIEMPFFDLPLGKYCTIIMDLCAIEFWAGREMRDTGLQETSAEDGPSTTRVKAGRLGSCFNSCTRGSIAQMPQQRYRHTRVRASTVIEGSKTLLGYIRSTDKDSIDEESRDVGSEPNAGNSC